jgi:hypothetical protein
MAIHEIEKNVKIIDELIIYLFNKGYHVFDFNLNFKPEASVITITVEDTSQELMKIIKEDIHIERDEELEDYGWELLGESCESREIICVGMLVDKMDLSFDGKNTKIELYRSH